MSGGDESKLYIRAQLARIDRALSENRRHRKERNKSLAEQRKLMSEAGKLTCDDIKSSVFALATLVGGVLGAATFFLRVLGRE